MQGKKRMINNGGDMILFDENRKVFKIDTPDSSYIMGIVDGYLGHIYYGKRIEGSDMSYLLRTEEYPFYPSKCMGEKAGFLDFFPMEYPCGNIGDFRESCLDIENSSGQCGSELKYKSYNIFKGKKELEGLPATWGQDCETLEIVLYDEVLNLEVILSYSIFDGIDAIAKSVRIVNKGTQDLLIKKALSSSITMEQKKYKVLTLSGSWARERKQQYQQIGYGSVVNESKRGISSHQQHPFSAVVSENIDQCNGEVYGMHFVYSGNFISKVELDQFDNIRAVMGIHPDNFSWQLNENESFQTPEVVLVYSDKGLGHMTRTLHSLYRKHLIRSKWKDCQRPVLINNWEATYFDFDTDKILKIAKEASECGIEMFVLDDGWFGERNDCDRSLGDWVVNENKLSGGLDYLVKEINKLGMKFGIWFEPEMVSPDSNIYREHPEWALAIENREPTQARNQLVLDFSRPEVLDYVYNSISAVLKSANIEYIKWDMNRPLTDTGSSYLPKKQQGEIMHRHVLGLYSLQEKLIKEFPDLLIENCASGGARFDPGMLYYSPQIWCSDDTDAIERLSIQEGTQLLYPLSTIGAHVSASPNHIVGRNTSFDLRGCVALAGTFGYELDITKLADEEKQQICEQIKRYKKYSRLIQQGDYYRIASYYDNKEYDCLEIMDDSGKNGIINYTQVMAKANVHSRRIYLQGLDENAYYRIENKVYSGSALMFAGFLIQPIHGDFAAKIFEITKE